MSDCPFASKPHPNDFLCCFCGKHISEHTAPKYGSPQEQIKAYRTGIQQIQEYLASNESLPEEVRRNIYLRIPESLRSK
jgi:predicted Zn-dependent protease with MMP-like domain